MLPFVSNNPEDSFLVLGDGQLLKISEIKSNTDLGGIHLVVLSACETAKGGADQDGIEVSGISYYFLTGGAKSVIASLWLVNDASTSRLMRFFYSNLSTGEMTKTRALQKAQISMITGQNQPEPRKQDSERRSSVERPPSSGSGSTPISRNFSHPYYWAPFILIGNGL
jgi:CHAT domain-containing protein